MITMKGRVILRCILAMALLSDSAFVFGQSDSAALEKLRTESGVDPTRVASRISYSILYFDQANGLGQVNGRSKLTIGVNRWSFSVTAESISRISGIPGAGFSSGFGDVRFSLLNAFYVKGKSALAASAEFSVPTGKAGFGSQYFSVNPGLTYSYTIQPTLIVAFQPQYTLHLLKDPAYPDLKVLTIRMFLAKFTKSGYFLVFEPRPVFDFVNKRNDLVFSPIIGKSLGAGFNMIFLAEYSTNSFNRKNRGTLMQIGVNKNF
jgi:Putative MetA-pathway of phenol degradation